MADFKCLMDGQAVLHPCSAQCHVFGDCITAFHKHKEKQSKPMTNGDRIRAKEDSALAEFGAELVGLAIEIGLAQSVGRPTPIQLKAIKHKYFLVLCEWLKQPVEVET